MAERSRSHCTLFHSLFMSSRTLQPTSIFDSASNLHSLSFRWLASSSPRTTVTPFHEFSNTPNQTSISTPLNLRYLFIRWLKRSPKPLHQLSLPFMSSRTLPTQLRIFDSAQSPFSFIRWLSVVEATLIVTGPSLPFSWFFLYIQAFLLYKSQGQQNRLD